jgi:hypothetical protein
MRQSLSLLSGLAAIVCPAILVGHFYGGSVITGGGTDDRVVGLVYIAALAPDVVVWYAWTWPREPSNR